MREILLTQGRAALVDDADFELVDTFNWHTVKSGRGFYAARKIKQADGSWTLLFLHQFLTGPGGPKIDHKDGNGLNNRRNNLRPATRSQNGQGFQRKRIGTSSPFRGVCWHLARKKWEAGIKINGKDVYLGLFISETDAARAYDTAARKYYGEFASPNFPL